MSCDTPCGTEVDACNQTTYVECHDNQVDIVCIGTQGPPGTPSGDTAEACDILPTETAVVDNFDTLVRGACKWLVTVESTDGVFKYFEVVTMPLGAAIDWSVSNILGDYLPLDVVIVDAGSGVYSLEITNDHTSNVCVNATKMGVIR